MSSTKRKSKYKSIYLATTLLTLIILTPFTVNSEEPTWKLAPFIGLKYPTKDIITNNDTLKVTIYCCGESRRLTESFLQRIRELGFRQREIVPVEGIDIYLDGKVIQSWENKGKTKDKKKEGISRNIVEFSLNLADIPEGNHTLYAQARWLDTGEWVLGKGKTKEITVTIDRIPPLAIDPYSLTITNGYLEEGVIYAYGRSITLQASLDPDVRCVVARGNPFCIIKRNIEDSSLTLTIRGLNVRKTTLSLTFIDNANSQTKMEYKIKRVY